MRQQITSLTLFSTLALSLAGDALAEGSLSKASDQLEDAATKQNFGFREGSFVVAPIPFKNPLLGAGLVLGGGYLYQVDEESNTSMFGLGVLKSDNGSEGYALSGAFAWDNNRWQLSATLGEADVNYDIYVFGLPVPLKQTGQLFDSELLYGVTPEISFGGKMRYLDTNIALVGPGTLPGALALDTDLEIANLGFVARWDTRDSTLYPSTGHFLEFEAMGGDILNSSPSRTYATGHVNFTHYHSLTSSTIVASRLSGCHASTDAPFFDKCALGGYDAFRGFSSTQYYDTHSASAQVELRQQLTNRFRAVAFAGAGMVGPDWDALDLDTAHLAGGVGIRFKLSKKFDADFAVDWSYNDEDTELIYIYVGQRF